MVLTKHKDHLCEATALLILCRISIYYKVISTVNPTSQNPPRQPPNHSLLCAALFLKMLVRFMQSLTSKFQGCNQDVYKQMMAQTNGR